jgi:ornithine cyclodeaminase/alanine dehydrogenase-like protein (mu-crystallin family)
MSSTMSSKTLLYLSREHVAQCLTLSETIIAVETALHQLGTGVAQQSPKITLTPPPHAGSVKAMSAYLPAPTGIVATKNYAFYPDNRQYDLPSVPALIVLMDPVTGQPLAVMDGTLITAWRTAATSSIAAKYLANPDSNTLGIIGAGVQGESHLHALYELFPLEHVKVMDEQSVYRHAFASNMGQQLGLAVQPVPTYHEAVQDVDIVVTATTGHGSFVQASWLRPGTTVLKVGSHRELASSLLHQLDKIVVDSWQHTAGSAPEIRDMQLRRDAIHAELPEIVLHQKEGRQQPSERILFISLGMAVEDAGAAYLAYRNARHLHLGVELEL